jgi:hypothetical protein
MVELDYTFLNGYNPSDKKRSLSGIYHKGQKHIWEGQATLDYLISKHGLPELSQRQRIALSKVLSLILWGEYTAWQTSAILTFKLNDFHAKMAATSQTHDEARHFYVMCDYFDKVLDISPHDTRISTTARTGLEAVMNVNSLSKRLLGMQLMVEPVAITIFKLLQESNIDPILTELLTLYIKDEARHIALGVKHLPAEIDGMSWPQILQLFVWQSRLLKFEIDGLFELKPQLEEIGIDYQELFREAERRQINSAKEMLDVLGWNIPIDSTIRKVTRTYMMYKDW